jgi:uncharacterized protein YecE (DUF72 family)
LIRVGPAGWSYPDWEGCVYPLHKPPGFHPLRFLAHFVDCLEINSTFYALPRSEHAGRWCELVAELPNFRFLAKLHQSFTHEALPEEPALWEENARRYLDGIAPLRRAKRLAAVLVQFPANFHFGPLQVHRLGRIHALFRELPLVLEVRHQSWFAPPALDTIRGLAYSLAWIDLPPAWNHPPAWHEPTGPIGYLRLHGRNSGEWFRRGATRDDRYDYLYGKDEVVELARRAHRIEKATGETFVITNNHFEGKAVANALELSSMLRGEVVAAPADLVRTYPRLEGRVRVEGQHELFE